MSHTPHHPHHPPHHGPQHDPKDGPAGRPHGPHTNHGPKHGPRGSRDPHDRPRPPYSHRDDRNGRPGPHHPPAGKPGDIEQGTISINAKGKGFIRLESRAKLGREGDIPVQPEDIGEAFQGDTVEVELYSGFRGMEHARVVRVVEQKKNTFVGTLIAEASKPDCLFVETDDKRANVIFEIKKTPELEHMITEAGFIMSDIIGDNIGLSKEIKVLVEKTKWLRLPHEVSKQVRMDKRNQERAEMDRINDMLARGEKPEPTNKRGRGNNGNGSDNSNGSALDLDGKPESVLDFSTTRLALAEIIKVIGESGKNNTEMESIVLERGFDVTFPSIVVKEAEEASAEFSKITEEELKKRRDMRGVFTCTIDPVDAKDFDDALSIREATDEQKAKCPEAVYEIGIHIADVAHYVREKTALDAEAKKRAFSVYLVDRTIPMLPSVLSNGACSLNPHEDRFAFSSIFLTTKNGDILDRWFGRTIIHSDKRFTYENAQEVLTAHEAIANDQAAIDAFSWRDESTVFAKELLEMNRIAKIYLAQKKAHGAIDFETTEIKFKLDDNGKPIAVYKKERIDTHRLVEEYMLLANREVAKYVDMHNREGGHDDGKGGKVGGKQRPAVFRVHDNPDPDRIKELALFVQALGFDFNPGSKDEASEVGTQNDSKRTRSVSPKQLQKLLNDVTGSPQETMIKVATLRSMAKAIYATHDLGHFGLAFDNYTHFTSPIRRYPDLMIHRILADLLEGKIVPQNAAPTLEKICADSTRREIEAADSERASVKYKQVEFMLDKIGQEFDVTISGIAEFGMFVQEPESMAEGLIRLSNLKPDDFYTADTKNYRIYGENTDTVFNLGDTLHVRLENANLEEKMLDFTIIPKS